MTESPETNSNNERCYDDMASSLSMPGLFSDFALPARLLRLARERNDFPTDVIFDCAADGNTVIDTFYELLDKVDAALTDAASQQRLNIIQQEKFIIEVEGLDGSGKTTLVRRLQETLMPQAIATKTPSASLHDIRPLWDKRGGILARAFYRISNYVLEYEIANFYKEDIIIIDRWFASTCGYTVARPPSNYSSFGNESKERLQPVIADMPDKIFDWPKDLRLRPNILLVLQIDQSERQKRVEIRATSTGEGGASRFNPWDERLAKDTALGERILEALHRISGPVETFSINANSSIEDVTKQALDVIKLPLKRHLSPHVHFASNPLQWWIYMAQQLDCCDKYGKRTHHALWNLQVAYNNKYSGPIPVLKTVGLDRIDNEFVYYWTASDAFPSSESLWGSIIWEGGRYPTEFQWRAEGYLRRVTEEECTLRRYHAPRSLVAHVSACAKLCHDGHGARRRISRPDSYDDAVYAARQNVDSVNDDCVCMVRFVPIRIEVLRGGPSTRFKGHPQRFEWVRRSGANESAVGAWSMRSVLPFGPTPRMTGMGFRDLTVCIIGTHTSGKSTIGRKLAKLLGCQFDEELGEIERDSESLVEGGHLHGDGSSATTSSGKEDWDDFLLRKECERDTQFQDSNSSIRVVETWHVGNAAWYKLRQQQKSTDLDRYKTAIAKHQESSLVVAIQLMLSSPSTMVRRREADADNSRRLPMRDDEQECNQLFIALQNNKLKETLLDPPGIPFLQIDNNTDGGEAMGKVLCACLSFVQAHLHNQVLVP